MTTMPLEISPPLELPPIPTAKEIWHETIIACLGVTARRRKELLDSLSMAFFKRNLELRLDECDLIEKQIAKLITCV
jgi:hypothetical protein